MVINVPDEVAQRLEQLAKEQGASVGDLLTDLLDRYAPESPYGSLADLVRSAQEAGIASDQPVNTAERSREILNTEFADYLRRRMNNATDENHHG